MPDIVITIRATMATIQKMKRQNAIIKTF